MAIACLMCLMLGPQGPGPMAQGPRPQAPGPRSIVFSKRLIAPGFSWRALIPTRAYRFVKKIYCARILIEGARFPPFGFDIAEISSNSNEDNSEASDRSSKTEEPNFEALKLTSEVSRLGSKASELTSEASELKP